MLDVERRTQTRLTFDGQNAYPIWSPDGRTITYGGSPNGKAGLYRVAADGSSRPELLLATTSFPAPSSWSPDGRMLLYSQTAKAPRIWMLPVSGSAAGKPAPQNWVIEQNHLLDQLEKPTAEVKLAAVQLVRQLVTQASRPAGNLVGG